MRYEYKRVNTRSLAGLEQAETLQAEGWEIINNGCDTIQFQRPIAIKLIEIENVPKGDYFRRKNGKKVFIYKGYCRLNKAYEGQEFDDTSTCKYFKKGTMVEIDFDF